MLVVAWFTASEVSWNEVLMAPIAEPGASKTMLVASAISTLRPTVTCVVRMSIKIECPEKRGG
jgi:hypothetical protein